MKPKLFALLFFIAIGTNIKAQLNDKWLFGYASWGGPPFGNVNMDFSNGQLDSIYFYYRDMNFQFTNASICDSNGNLLFYTNGVYIANAQDDTMKNGSGLNPSWYTTQFNVYGLLIQQGATIIPIPGNDSLYLLIHETADFPGWVNIRPGVIYRSVINIKANNGLGEVILKNDTLINDTITSGAITCCKMGNGRDWWLPVAVYGDDVVFNSYLITPDSVILKQSQQFPINGLEGGTSCFSPDGSKFVWNNCYGVAFFDFDRCSGELTLLANIDSFPDGLCWIGSSISPNSRYYYLSHGQYIFQFDLQAANIPASLDTVAVNDGFYDPNPPFQTAFVLHQLAPDGKIYISHGNGTMSLHVIDDPDSAGIACDVQQHAVPLGRFNVTIPNFPNYDLGVLPGSPCDTLGLSTPNILEKEISVTLSPNPASNSFYIKYDIPTNENLVFVMYDSYGNEVLRKTLYGTFKKLLVHAEQLSNGIYFWRAIPSNSSNIKLNIGKSPKLDAVVNYANGKIVILH